jgi:hypothetical protein
VASSEPQDSTVPTYYMRQPGELERFLAEAPKLTPDDAAKIRRLLSIRRLPPREAKEDQDDD